jgi:lipopolysaccharide/colanic/teichoic acid biosynthesis glycosyltransferase
MSRARRPAEGRGFGEEVLRAMTTAHRQRGVARAIKALLDRSAALALLAILSPVLIAVAGVIRIQMGSPVLFIQRRPGLHGRSFALWKFRTMRSATGADGQPLPDAERLTRLGMFLRSTSLDELPQLWNVLQGDQSLVGPRPLLVEYLDRYTPEQARRHDVIPGITGWAQVNGRNAISWEQKLALDVWYVDHWSVALDIKILALTAMRVLRRKGIAHDGHVTMPEFLGVPGDTKQGS